MPKAKKPPTLFNPKPSRQIKVEKPAPAPAPARRPPDANGRPAVEKKPDESDLKFALPEGPYTEYKLVSSAAGGWSYDIFKFSSHKPVDVSTWARPVKMNRKDVQKRDAQAQAAAAAAAAASAVSEAVGPMVGPDGKPVIGMDGRIVMVDAAGRPIHLGNNILGTPGGSAIPSSSSFAKGKDGKGGGRKKFQKKTRQVFLIPEETRKLRREERFPWVMEDSAGDEVWVGQLDDVTRSETHGMFMPTTEDVFQFVPVHRWYKMHKKPKFKVMNLEEAEAEMQRLQKHKGVGQHRRLHKGIKAEEDAGSGSGSLVMSAGRSLGPGGRKLRTVDKGADLFGDDDEDGIDRKRKEREMGQEGDLDEVEYESDFADDDEKIEEHGDDDEEIKEMEERLKREYKSANKTREAGVDDTDDEDDGDPQLSGAGKTLKKLMRTHEKDDNYESDEEKNPYASSEEELEEEEPVLEKPAIDPSLAPRPSPPRSQTPTTSKPLPKPNGQTATLPPSTSRATSPVPPGHGGHSLLAKRATSPKPPKALGSRATSPSPLGPRASQLSPGRMGSRATSPVAQSPTSPSTPNVSVNPNKRKATDDGTAAAASTPGTSDTPKPKKQKRPPPSEPLDYNTVLDWLRANSGVSTRDCIARFSPYLYNEDKKKEFTTFIKRVAVLNNGILTLKNSYKNGQGLTPTPS